MGACVAAGLAIAALLAVPAAAVDRAQLALMPLAKAALGPDAAALRLDPASSGVLSNARSAADSAGAITAAGLARIGRVTGYVRDYNATGKGAGLLEVKTRVELYRSRSGAARGLAFWRGFDRRFGTSASGGVSLARAEFLAAGLGEEGFAIEYTLKVNGKPSVYEVDLLFRSRELLASLAVAAADRGMLRARTLALARRLQTQIERAR